MLRLNKKYLDMKLWWQVSHDSIPNPVHEFEGGIPRQKGCKNVFFISELDFNSK